MQKHNLPNHVYRETTRKFVESVISKDEHFSQPFLSAQYYGKTSIILYHYGRLAGEFPKEFSEQVLLKIKTDCHRILNENYPDACPLLAAITLGSLG